MDVCEIFEKGPWQYSFLVLTCLLLIGFHPGDFGKVDLSVLDVGNTHGWV